MHGLAGTVTTVTGDRWEAAAVRDRLLPLADLVTPNLSEAVTLARWVEIPDDRAGVGRSPNGSRINNVGRLTPGAGIESSTALTSDQTAAEALQEAETEVGVAEWSIGVRTLPCGVPDRRTDRPTVRPISALRPES